MILCAVSHGGMMIDGGVLDRRELDYGVIRDLCKSKTYRDRKRFVNDKYNFLG